MAERTAREVTEAMVASLERMDLNGFADLFAEDAVFEYPFGWPGAPSRFTDRETLREHLVATRADVPSRLTIDVMHAVLHETTDPEVVVVELEVEGTRNTGEAVRFASGVGVVRVRGGEVVHYRDYTNPVGAARALGRLAQLAAALEA
jgi:uncharacterized protein